MKQGQPEKNEEEFTPCHPHSSHALPGSSFLIPHQRMMPRATRAGITEVITVKLIGTTSALAELPPILRKRKTTAASCVPSPLSVRGNARASTIIGAIKNT